MQTEADVVKTAGRLPPGMTERRHRSDPRRDHQARAMVYCQMKLREAEKLPDGPEKTAAIAAVARMLGDPRAGASDRRKPPPEQKSGWTDEYFFP